MNAGVILFWLLALIATAIVVGVLVWPLARVRKVRPLVRREVNVQVLRDQLAELQADLAAGTLQPEQYEAARVDISRRLLEDLTADLLVAAPVVDPRQARGNRRVAIGIGIAVPVLMVAGYLYFGTPIGLDPEAVKNIAGADEGADNGAGGARRAISPEKVQVMIDALRKKLAEQPNDPQGAAMLARALNFIGKFDEAAVAYAQATKLNPDDATLLADYADALAMSQNRTLGPEPMKLVARALKIDPDNMKALALAATEAFQRKDYRTAIADWRRALPKAMAQDPDLGKQFRDGILEANQLGGGNLVRESDLPAVQAVAAPVPAMAAPPQAAGQSGAQAASGPSISGQVSVAQALRDKVGPDDTVFIFAKAASGPPMPIAVLRAKVRDLPMPFRLDDSQAMMPGVSLGSAPALIVGARISHTGNAMPASGDLQVELRGVQPGATGVQLEINQVRP